MALIFSDGFDHYDSAQLNKKWDFSGGTPWVSPPAIYEGQGRFETNAMGHGDSWGRVIKAMPNGPLGYVTAGVAYKPTDGLVSAPGMIISFVSGGTWLCGVGVTETFNLYFWSGEVRWYANTPIRNKAYNYVEIQIQSFHGSAGIAKVWLQEVLVLNLSDINSNSGSSYSVAEAVALGGPASWQRTDYPGIILYDDFYLTDNTGDDNKDQLGDVRVVEQLPTADVDKEWTRNTGSDNYALVDDPYDSIDDDTTYITTQTEDAKDTYTFPDLPTTTGEVKGVMMNFYAKKIDSGSRGVSMTAKLSGGTYGDGTERRVGGDYIFYQSIMERDPTDTLWTISSVNSTNFGPKLTT